MEDSMSQFFRKMSRTFVLQNSIVAIAVCVVNKTASMQWGRFSRLKYQNYLHHDCWSNWMNCKRRNYWRRIWAIVHRRSCRTRGMLQVVQDYRSTFSSTALLYRQNLSRRQCQMKRHLSVNDPYHQMKTLCYWSSKMPQMTPQRIGKSLVDWIDHAVLLCVQVYYAIRKQIPYRLLLLGHSRA